MNPGSRINLLVDVNNIVMRAQNMMANTRRISSLGLRVSACVYVQMMVQIVKFSHAIKYERNRYSTWDRRFQLFECGNTTIRISIDGSIPNHRAFQQFIITCMHTYSSLSLSLSLSLHSPSTVYCTRVLRPSHITCINIIFCTRRLYKTHSARCRCTLHDLQHKRLYDMRNVYGAYPRPNL